MGTSGDTDRRRRGLHGGTICPMKTAKLQPALVTGSFFFMIGSAAFFRLANYDIWWHLATGRLIAGGGGIPHSDPFSFTAQGVEWVDHEWLFQLLMYGIHSLGGPLGLVLAKTALILATAAVVYRFVRRETGLPPAATALFLIPFFLAGRDRFIVRPELFTLFFSAILLDALFRSRPRAATAGDLWWIPFLFVAWANLHGGMIVGLVLMCLFLLGRLMPWIWRVGAAAPPAQTRSLPSTATILALIAASTAAGLVNPFLHRVYTVPFQLTALIESGLYQNMEWIRPPWPATWLYHLVVLASLLLIGTRIRRPDWVSIFPLLFLMAISWQYVRNIALFGMLAPLLLVRIRGTEAPPVEAGVDQPLRGAGDRPLTISWLLLGRGPVPVVAAVAFLLLGLFLLTGNYRFASGIGVDPRRVPARAVDFFEQTQPPGNLLNAYVFGGYISWRLYPETRIFIDGRNEVFAHLRRQLALSVHDGRLWAALLDEHGINTALLEYIEVLEEVTVVDAAGGAPQVIYRPYAVNHFPRSRWALVYWDDMAMVYVRRSVAAAPLIETYEFRHVYPESAACQLELIAGGVADLEQCRLELQQKLGNDPGSRRARDLLAALDSVASPFAGS